MVVRAYPVDPSTLPSRLFPCLYRNRCNYLPGGQTARHALFHKQFFCERSICCMLGVAAQLLSSRRVLMISELQNSIRCEPLITADRAAELLKLHPKTVKRLAQAGSLPGMKIGRVWRFRESSLDAWMSAQLQYSGHPSPKGEMLQ